MLPLTVAFTTMGSLGFCAWAFIVGTISVGYLGYLVAVVPLFFGAWMCKAMMRTRGPAGPALGVMGPVAAAYIWASLLSTGHPATENGYLLVALVSVGSGAVAALALHGWWWRLGALAVLAGIALFIASR